MSEPNLGVLLFIPYRAMENRVFHALAAAGFDDITPAQARVFQRIGPHGTRPSELAEAAQITKQTAGFLVDQLERSGYVHRAPDPADARARLITISERGQRVVRATQSVVAEVEAAWAADLGARDAAHLRRILLRLRVSTDPFR